MPGEVFDHTRHSVLPRSPHPAHGCLKVDWRAGRSRRAIARGLALRPVATLKCLVRLLAEGHAGDPHDQSGNRSMDDRADEA
jgi:hypothetical protein